MSGKPVFVGTRVPVAVWKSCDQIADTFSHLEHHRGQLSVYRRLNEQRVASI